MSRIWLDRPRTAQSPLRIPLGLSVLGGELMAPGRLFAASTMDWTLVPTPSVSLPTETLTQVPGASLETVTETPGRRFVKVLVDEVAVKPPPRSSVASAAVVVLTSVAVPVESTAEKPPAAPEAA